MKFVIIVLGLCFSYWVSAKEYCYLQSEIDEEEPGFVLGLGKKGLVCFEAELSKKLSPQIKQYPKEQIKIVKSNIYELSKTGVTLLHHAHGYNLVVAKEGTLNVVDHHSHMQLIALEDYRPIIKVSNGKSGGNRNPNIEKLVNAVDADQWLSDVTTLSSWSRATGQDGNIKAAAWIMEKMNQLNLQVTEQIFSFDIGIMVETQNIIGVQVGTKRPDDWYIIGAHMDSTSAAAHTGGSAPGAVDNASGCAAVLEMARIASGYQFEGTLIFICFGGEEMGLKGSKYHAENLIANGDKDRVKAVFNIDMIGYSSDVNREVIFESTTDYQWLIDVMANNAILYAPSISVFTTTGAGMWSDHDTYASKGIPAVLSADNDWGIYPDYHKFSDLPENIITEQGELIIKINMAAIAELAALVDHDLIFKSQFE